MPPPNFTPGAPPIQPTHIPKATQARFKDAFARIRAPLLATSPPKIDLSAAERAIDALLHDPNVAISASASPESLSLRLQISQKLNSELLTLWDEMDQRDSLKQAMLVKFITQLAELLGSAAIVVEWFDILLRPILKDPLVSDHLAGQARALVIMAALATPSSAYKDEPPPVRLWPTVADADLAREIGGIPYPKAATDSYPPLNRSRSGTLSDKAHLDIVSRTAVAVNSSSRKNGYQNVDMHRQFTQRLFDLYTSEASAPLRHELDDDGKPDILDRLQSSAISSNLTSDAPKPGKPYLSQAVDPGDAKPIDIAGTTWKGNLEAIIITFGQERPTEFFHHLSSSFEEPLHRIPIMLLVTIFVRLNSIHTYHITKTSLLTNIAMSLQLDTSTTLATLEITSLIMLIPHVPDWIASGGAGGVPVLLAIFARIIDWRKLGPGWEHRVGRGEEMENLRMQFDEEYEEVARLSKRLHPRPDICWRRLESSVDSETAMTPDAIRFFTIVYGIFPCNMVRFLRGPIDYLRKAQYQPPLSASWQDLIHEPELQKRCEIALRRHSLHPSIVSSNAELEITKKERWQQHDAADITAECVSLSVESWQTVLWRHPPTHELSKPAVMEGTTPSPLSRKSSAKTSSAQPGKALDTSAIAKDGATGGIESARLIGNVLAGYADIRWGGAFRRHSLSSAASMSPGPTSTSRIPRSVTLSALKTELPFEGDPATLSCGPPSPLLGQSSISLPSCPASPTVEQLTSTYPTMTSSQGLSLGGKRGRTLNVTADTTPAFTASTISTPFQSLFLSDTRPYSPPVSGRPVLPNVSSTLLVDHPPSTLCPPASAPTSYASQSTSVAPGSLTSSPLRAVGGEALQERSDHSVSRELGDYYTMIKYLQRENLLLRGELNFELYLKDQHLRHIGRLHRDRILASTSEAERQNLYRLVKSLRNQLAAVDAQMDRQRNEANMIKSRHAQWESELQGKLKSFREERRGWTTESRELKAYLETLTASHEAQTRQLNEASAELFELRIQMSSIAPKAGRVKDYEEKCAHLTRCLALWDQDVKSFERQRREMEILLGQWRGMEMLLDAADEARLQLEREIERSRMVNEKLENGRRRWVEGKEGSVRTVNPEFLSANDDSAHDEGNDSHHEVNSKVEELEAEILLLRARAEAAEAELRKSRSTLSTAQNRSEPHALRVLGGEASLKSLQELQEFLSPRETLSSAGTWPSSPPFSPGIEESGVDEHCRPSSLGSPHLALAEAGAASASLEHFIQETEAAEGERNANPSEDQPLSGEEE